MLLTASTYKLVAAKYYNNPTCLTVQDFERDLLKVASIRRQVIKYHTKGVIDERKTLNLFIELGNCFDPSMVAELIFYRTEPIYWTYLIPFMTFLGILPTYIFLLQETPISTTSIQGCANIINKLKEL
jgi:hypothetical protein